MAAKNPKLEGLEKAFKTDLPGTFDSVGNRTVDQAKLNWETNKDRNSLDSKLNTALIEAINNGNLECGRGYGSLLPMDDNMIDRIRNILSRVESDIREDANANYQDEFNKISQEFYAGSVIPKGSEDIRLDHFVETDGAIIGIAADLSNKAQAQLWGEEERSKETINQHSINQVGMMLASLGDDEKSTYLSCTREQMNAGRGKYDNWRAQVAVQHFQSHLPDDMIVDVQQSVSGSRVNKNNFDYGMVASYLLNKYNDEPRKLNATLGFLTSTSVTMKKAFRPHVIEEIKWVSKGISPIFLTGCKLTGPKLVQSLSIALGKVPVMTIAQLGIPIPGRQNVNAFRAIIRTLLGIIRPYVLKTGEEASVYAACLSVATTALRFYNPRQVVTMVEWGKRPGEVKLTGACPLVFDLDERRFRAAVDELEQLVQDNPGFPGWDRTGLLNPGSLLAGMPETFGGLEDGSEGDSG